MRRAFPGQRRASMLGKAVLTAAIHAVR